MNPCQDPSDPPAGDLAARFDLPAAWVIATVGLHTLAWVSFGQWLVLIGPDSYADPIDWIWKHAPSARDWTCLFETFGKTLVTHFLKP